MVLCYHSVLGVFSFDELYLRIKVLYGLVLFCFTAHTIKNLNAETQKSEQKLFAQISLSQY